MDPPTFASLSSEETRLQLELDRLKVKHTRLSQYRDKLLIKSFARVTTTGDRGDILRGVEEGIKRADRVARQIYICNDQLRQMEIMKRDHELGVLLWALQHEDTGARRGEDMVTTPVDVSASGHEDDDRHEQKYDHEYGFGQECQIIERPSTPEITHVHGQVPEIQLTRATIYDPDEPCEYLTSPDQEATVDHDDREDGPMSKVSSPTETERPLSTLSISLSPINLGFPLPPSRPVWPSFHQDYDTELQHMTEIGTGTGQT